MTNRFRFVLFLALILPLWHGNLHATCNPLAGGTKDVRPASKWVRFVDPDGRILDRSPDDGSVWQHGRDLRALMPTGAELRLLPRKHAVVSRDQLTCAENGWKISAIASVNTAKLSDEYTLSVFLEKDKLTKLILRKRLHEIVAIDLGDINGDDNPVLAVSFMEDWALGPSTFLKLWAILPGGNLEPINLDFVYAKARTVDYSRKSELSIGDYKIKSYSLVLEQESPVNGGTERIRHYYKWAKEKHRYIPNGMTRIKEEISAK